MNFISGSFVSELYFEEKDNRFRFRMYGRNGRGVEVTYINVFVTCDVRGKEDIKKTQ